MAEEEHVAVEEAEEEPEEEPTSWLRGGLEGTAAPGLSAVLAWLASPADEPSQPARAERTPGRAGATPRLATRATTNTPRSATRSATRVATSVAAAEWRGAEVVPETPPRTPGASAGFDFSELKRISFLRTPPSAHGARVSHVFKQPSHQQRDVHSWLTSVDETPSAPTAMFAGLEAVSESPPAALDAAAASDSVAAGPALARGSSLPPKPPPARRTAAGAPPSNAPRAAASKPALGSRIGVPAPSNRIPLAGAPRPASAEISSSRAAIQGSSRAVVRPRTSGGGKLSLSASASSLPAPKSRR